MKTTPVPSPCIRNCCLDEDDICLGCFRSIEEIMQWSQASENTKRCILENADTRKKKHHEKYPDTGGLWQPPSE
ncbi:MAG TPA: DUF1289 domain-containing protein [Gammaproteobacteria bacterium]|nr:DUF1289 domain-containing protein [Gammaproteobacteria bacterium]